MHRSDFVWVQRKGRRYDLGHFIACVCRTPEQGTRIGITTSKKVGKAVVRNRVRRLVREAVRHWFLPQFPHGFAVVFIAKKDLSLDLSQTLTDRDIQKLVAQIQHHVPKQSTIPR